MKQVIEHLPETGKVSISWIDGQFRPIPNSKIDMDFNPVINFFKLQGSFCLVHWQAKPFGLRKWGIFCNQSKRYYSVDYDRVEINPNRTFQLLQINEKEYKNIRPTAVLLITDASVNIGRGKVIVS